MLRRIGRFSNYEKQVERVDHVKLSGSEIVLKLSNIFKHLNKSGIALDKTRLEEKKGRPDGIVG